MPMYEYACSKCGTTFEVLQKFSDAPLETHPECGGTVEKVLSAPAFQFKGTGWYITDYAKGGKADGAKANGDGKPADAKAGDAGATAASTTTSESKPSESKASSSSESTSKSEKTSKVSKTD